MISDPNQNSEGHKRGAWLEPIKECTVVIREAYADEVVQKLTLRKERWVTVVMDLPARGSIGYMAGEFGNDVHDQGTINHVFKGYELYKGAANERYNACHGELQRYSQGQ